MRFFFLEGNSILTLCQWQGATCRLKKVLGMKTLFQILSVNSCNDQTSSTFGMGQEKFPEFIIYKVIFGLKNMKIDGLFKKHVPDVGGFSSQKCRFTRWSSIFLRPPPFRLLLHLTVTDRHFVEGMRLAKQRRTPHFVKVGPKESPQKKVENPTK